MPSKKPNEEAEQTPKSQGAGIRARKTPPSSLFGEYDSPLSSRSHAVWTARQTLMDTTNVVLPDMLRDLRETVLPLLAEYARKNPNGFWNEHPDFMADYQRVRDAIRDWAAQYHADVDWIRDGAWQTVCRWIDLYRVRDELRWSPEGPSVRTGYTRDFTFSCARWEPELQTWSQYSREARRNFEEALRRYESHVRSKAKSLGMVAVRARFSPDNFKWFILKRFKGWPPRKIAEAGGDYVDVSSVNKGVKTVRELIDWPTC